MKNIVLAFAVILGISMQCAALADALPSNTVIWSGEISAARHLYGDEAEMGKTDATWVFSDIATLDRFFDIEGNADCDDSCVNHLIHTLGGVRAVPIGLHVRVLARRPDPEAPTRYHVCQISGGANGWTMCSSLQGYPPEL